MIKLWDFVKIKTSLDGDMYQVVGEIRRGETDIKYIISNSDEELVVYEQQVEKVELPSKKKAGYK